MNSLEYTKTGGSYAIFVVLLSLGKSPNIFRFNFLQLFNEDMHMVVSKNFSCSNSLQFFSNVSTWSDLGPA